MLSPLADPRALPCSLPVAAQLFEYWLHPQRYRTEMCQFGAACTRPVCFFAHGEHQLRHTSMPGGPQPVVGPPEPMPSLNGGFGSRTELAAVDPAVKQQQQLMALQAAAAGFSQQQQQQQQQAAAAVAVAAVTGNSNMVLPGVDVLGGGGSGDHTLHQVASFPSMMDAGGAPGLDANSMASLHGSLAHHMPASSPLSAPLPQLSPGMLAALQGMHAPGGPQGSHHGAVSPVDGQLLHQHSALPATGGFEPLSHGGGRLQRSLTATPAMNAAAAAVAARSTSNLDELSQQLAVMQLMQQQHGGASMAASGPLPSLGDPNMDSLISWAQLQQQQSQQAVAASAGFDLVHLLPQASADGQHDSSLSCPLPPVFGSAAGFGVPRGPSPHDLHHHHHLGVAPSMAAVSCGLPRVPTAGGSSMGVPTSPAGSDTSRDAPSPVGANGRDTQVPAPSRKGQPWSVPVSPCTSTGKGEAHNDLLPGGDTDDARLGACGVMVRQSSSVSSSTTSEPAPQQQAGGRLSLGKAPSTAAHMPSFSAGVGASPGGLVSTGSGVSSNGESAPLLLVGDSPLEAAQVRAVLTAAAGADGSSDRQPGGEQPAAIGHDKAAALLANMDAAAVSKLLALMQQQPHQQ
jgi:hypothetical protein